MTMSIGKNTIDGRKLLSYVERIEVVTKEIKELQSDIKDIIGEAEREGYTPKGIRFAVKVRSQKPRQFEEDEQLRDMYLHAIGMAEEPPLFRQLDAFAGEQLARDEIIERFKELVPTKGEITLKMEGGPPMRLWRDKDGKPHAEEVKPPKPAVRGHQAPAAARSPQAPSADVPEVDDDGAEEIGRQFARDDKPIISNPFPFGDKRRARFDEGWRKETGNDGMGSDD